jgi:hypothetical protein
VFEHPAGDLGPRAESQLAEDSADVVARSALGDPEVDRDLAVGETPRDEDNHLRSRPERWGAGSPADGSLGTRVEGGST